MRDGRIVEVMEVVGVEGSRVLFERYLPLHDTVLKRYRVAIWVLDFGIISLWEVKFKRGTALATTTVYELCCRSTVDPQNQNDLSFLVHSFSGTVAQAAGDCYRGMSHFGIISL